MNTRPTKKKTVLPLLLGLMSLGLVGSEHFQQAGRATPPGGRMRIKGDKKAAKRLRKLREQSKRRNRKAA